MEDYKIKGPPYAVIEPPKNILIKIPDVDRNYKAFTITVHNPTDHAIQVDMVNVTWVNANPVDTTLYLLDGLLDVPAGGSSNPVNLPGFSVGPNENPGVYQCEIYWGVSVTDSAYGTVNVKVGFKFKTNPWVALEKVIGDLGSAIPRPPFYQFFLFDRIVNSADLTMFIRCLRGAAPPGAMYLADLGSASTSPPYYQFFKCDGKVDSADTTMFIRCYRGQGPDP